MSAGLTQMIQKWSRNGDEPDDLLELFELVLFLEKRVFGEYEPCRGTDHPAFLARLERWLATPQDEEVRQSLFRLLGEVYFVGRRELEVLHVAAFEDIIAHWLVDKARIAADKDLTAKLDDEIASTWFCPITDSMEIARFCHLNGISGGHDFRPDWRSLAKFGDVEKVRDYLGKTNTRRLVLLEDFVGTGNQASASIVFAGDLTEIDVLCCPLVITQDGLSHLTMKALPYSHVDVTPAVVLPESCHVRRNPPSGGDPSPWSPMFREALLAVHSDVAVGKPKLNPFGFGGLGPLVIPFTNCPNNVPPAFHRQTGAWEPLFPRSERV